ncbi:MAG: GGDEF domain-containing response regulator [Terriglobia bacterium]
MRVLIAEDDPVSRRVLQAHLSKWGYDVQATRDGQEAWDALRQADAPRLAILDWMMPSLDGIDVVRRLRKEPGAAYVYVVLLTAKGQKEDLLEGLEAGADDYLTKPFDAHELQARLRTGRRILDLQTELIAAQEALRKEATHDYLTGVWNRAGILDLLQRECARTLRAKGAVSVIMADLDHFKSVNDTYGHLVGDDVLREAARRMHASIRAYDSIGRYGGEEFIVVLPECDAAGGHQQAERLRLGVGSQPFETTGGAIRITLSLGVAAMSEGSPPDYQTLLRLADAALYRAKEAGRDRTCMAGEAHVPLPAQESAVRNP